MNSQQDWWIKLAELLQHIVTSEEHNPVRKPVSSCRDSKCLDLELTTEGIGIDSLFHKLKELTSATPSTASTAFFNQLFAGRDQAAVVGDTLACALNNSMYTWKVAGHQVSIERLLIQELCRIIGYGDGEGTFTPGGSLSNLLAMLLARNCAFPEIRETGFSPIPGTMYTSADGHYSIRKNAGILGMGRQFVRDIPVDQHGAMRVDDLQMSLEQDLAQGFQPLLINATAGTTVRGAFDSLERIAVLARRFNVWFHIDGAFGGPLIMCDEFREHFKGVELSDSFTWDAHKLMGVPLTCSVLLVRQKGLLLKNLNEHADYIFQGDHDQTEPGMTSLQCGRRNDALKLWSAWQMQGHSGYARRFKKLRELIQYARNIVLHDPSFIFLEEPQSLTLCFSVKGASVKHICTLLEEQQRALVGYGTINGRSVIRLVCANSDVEFEDIDKLFTHIRKVIPHTG